VEELRYLVGQEMFERALAQMERESRADKEFIREQIQEVFSIE
jgi:hypothetical protein